MTVRDGGWYSKGIEDGDLWPWVWLGEEDEGWNGLTLVGFSWAYYRLCGKGLREETQAAVVVDFVRGGG